MSSVDPDRSLPTIAAPMLRVVAADRRGDAASGRPNRCGEAGTSRGCGSTVEVDRTHQNTICRRIQEGQ